ncbi:MAG: ClpXP protease specificity-enhancing factor SspB [Myxococcales bacterium]
MATRVPSKKETLLAYLARGIAMVHLDARRPGVSVPAQYATDAHLRLNLSYRYSIPDLEVRDELVQVTLSFGGRPFHCVLPWASIFGITCNGTGEGQVWPEDLPVEVVNTLTDRHAGKRRNQDSRVAQAPQEPRRRPPLSAVDGDLKEPPAAKEQQQPTPEAKRHLRLVR